MRKRQQHDKQYRYIRLAAIAMMPISILTIIAMVATSNAPEQAETPTQAITTAIQQATTEPIETPTQATPAPTDEPWMPDEADVQNKAKTISGEANLAQRTMNPAAGAWCILNRGPATGYPDTIEGVVTSKHQFAGYDQGHPVTDELRDLAIDVLQRWHSEQDGEAEVGRVLPSDYTFFWGDGYENYFTNEWKGTDYWDWSMPNPYEN
jgi:hypothetical protein